MTDELRRIEAATERYERACHAMQSGVAFLNGPECSNKHLRVGVNSAMVETSVLQAILVRKGIITKAEHMEMLADAMESEVCSYQVLIEQKTGAKITLA